MAEIYKIWYDNLVTIEFMEYTGGSMSAGAGKIKGGGQRIDAKEGYARIHK